MTKVWPVQATTAALVELGDHLRCERVTRVVLESTSDYWRPFFYYLLEAAGFDGGGWSTPATGQERPGPAEDGQARRGVVGRSWPSGRWCPRPLVPAEPMRQVRDFARARFDLVEDRTRVKQRIEKLLEDALIKDLARCSPTCSACPAGRRSRR